MIATETSVRKIGNSQGIILDKKMCDEVGMTCGCTVEVVNCGGYLKVIPKPTEKKPRIGIAKGQSLVTDEWYTDEADSEVAALFLEAL